MTNRDIDHVSLRVAETLAAKDQEYPKTRVRGTVGVFSIVYRYRNERNEEVVDCAGDGRRLEAVTLDRLEAI